MSEIFNIDCYGFWKQKYVEKIDYNEQYKSKQSTTKEMTWLRFGVFASVVNINIKQFLKWKCCDVGSGNGTFAKQMKNVFGQMKQYDLSGETITQQQLYNTKWDAIFLTDVLQHFDNVDDLFKIKFKYLFLSFPECPKVEDYKQLKNWKHYKPNQHIYMLNRKCVIKWMQQKGYELLYCGNIEDSIRKSNSYVNITTLIFKNKNFQIKN